MRTVPIGTDGYAAILAGGKVEREFFIDNLLVRIHFIIVMIRWTGLAPWEFEFPVPGSLPSTFLSQIATRHTVRAGKRMPRWTLTRVWPMDTDP